MSEPRGPVYMTVPQEAAMLRLPGKTRFPTRDELGVARPAWPDPSDAKRVAEWLVKAQNPVVILGQSGRNSASVAPLVRLAELLALPMTDSDRTMTMNFPTTHPLSGTGPSAAQADVVVVIETPVPYMPANAPKPGTKIVWVDPDPVQSRYKTMEFHADVWLPVLAGPFAEAVYEQATAMLTKADMGRIEERRERLAQRKEELRKQDEDAAMRVATRDPISPRWVGYQIGQMLEEQAIVLDDTLSSTAAFRPYHGRSLPGSYFKSGGSAGGWGTGAAFGAKTAAPDRDVVLVTGDGYFMFGSPLAALWSSGHYKTPFLTVVFVNRSYSTGTAGVDGAYPGGYAASAGYEGGLFDPPPDFAKLAEVANGYGESVTDPAEVGPALASGAWRRCGTARQPSSLCNSPRCPTSSTSWAGLGREGRVVASQRWDGLAREAESHEGQHLACEASGLPLVVVERVEGDEPQARLGDLREPLGALLRRSVDADALRPLTAAGVHREPGLHPPERRLRIVLHADEHALRGREGCGVASVGFEAGAHRLLLFQEAGRRRCASAHPTVAQPGGAVERSGGVSPEPERDGPLDGRRADEGVVQLPEPPFEADALAGPEELHEHQPLLEAGRFPRRRSAERLGELRTRGVPHPDSGDEPSVREAVERGEALGEVDRVAQDADEDRAAEEHPFGEGGGVGEQGDGREVVLGVDGLLHHPAAVVAQLLDSREEGRQHGDVDLAGEPLGYGDAATQVGVDDGGSPESVVELLCAQLSKAPVLVPRFHNPIIQAFGRMENEPAPRNGISMVSFPTTSPVTDKAMTKGN